MRKLLAVLLCLGLCGCETMATQINLVSLGMSKSDVINKLGQPVSTSATKGTEYLNYSLWEKLDSLGFSGQYVPYYVCVKDGKVTAFGRKGDFGTTAQPKEVIELDQKVTTSPVNNGDNAGLEDKLKTLNDLLSRGLITQADFDAQKKALLDNYTSK